MVRKPIVAAEKVDEFKSPLTDDEQQCLVGISQLADFDAQADALRIQLEKVIGRAQLDDGFNSELIEYSYALQAAGDEELAILVTALCAGRMWSVELANRMCGESGAPALETKEKERIWACQRAWDITHGIKPTTPPLRVFDALKSSKGLLIAIIAVVAAVAIIGLLLVAV